MNPTPAPTATDAAEMLNLALRKWRRIEVALSPVIGHRRVAALFRRSLLLTAPARPWLAFPQAGLASTLALDSLRSAMAARCGAEAAAGKTTLAHQMMFALAMPERPALYFTVLGEPPLKMLRYQQPYAFFDAEAIHRSVRFVNLSEEALTGDFDQVLTRIAAEVEAHQCAFVLVDSFRSTDGARGHRPVAARGASQPAVLRAATRHADDELAGHHLPGRSCAPRRDRCDRRVRATPASIPPPLARRADRRRPLRRGRQPGPRSLDRPAHADALREFTIDDTGIRIGQTLPLQEGLLGGRPTKKQHWEPPPS